jgi:S-(hydroxymethyl)glutathione dehydrogenase / alcohol dehydrogenase
MAASDDLERMVRAAVLTSVGAPLVISQVELTPPGAGEVRVRLAAAGVCHSDLSLANGTLPQPMPAVLGHEATGIVAEVGEAVTHLHPGDPVLLNWSPSCGTCWFCAQGEPYLCEHAGDRWQRVYARLRDGTPVYAGLGIAAFGEETTVPAASVILLPPDLNLEQAALLGCAMLTGVGAVVNAARVQAGESVAVVGMGGVGLSVLQGARLVRAEPVIAIDLEPEKELLARTNGATDFLVSDDHVSKRIRELTGGRGVDHAFECVGTARTIRLAWSCTRRGGRTTVVGIGSKDDAVKFSALEIFHFARTLAGCVFGSSDVRRDVPLLVEHVRSGQIALDSLITDRITLDDVPRALNLMQARRGARSLIVFAST